MDYKRLAATTLRLINKNGRNVLFYKLDAVVANNATPWRGAASRSLIDEVACKGAFIIGNTSIPTESRGLAFDWVDNELLRVTRHVVIIPAQGLPVMDNYKMMKEESGAKEWDIMWGQCLQPGDTRLLYVFGLKE